MSCGCLAPTARRHRGGLGLLLLSLALALPGPAGARPSAGTAAPDASPPPPARRATAGGPLGVGGICDLIERAAASHALPPDFLARLIWKESRFDVRAISPKGAQGIAQFMPGTARIEGLADPFDPHLAIPASARHLSDLRREFGNLGLAAAAYNSGRNRVALWLAGSSGLPAETQDYVHSITAREADWFRVKRREIENRPLADGLGFSAACRKLPIIKTRAVFPPKPPPPPRGVKVIDDIPQVAQARAQLRVGGFGPLAAAERPKARNGRGASSTRGKRADRAAARPFCLPVAAGGRPCSPRRR